VAAAAAEDASISAGNTDLTRREWLAMLACVCTAFASQMTMPLWIAASIHHLGITDEVAGRVGALEFGAVAVVSLFVGLSLQRIPILPAMIVGMAILVAGNLASALTGNAVLLGLGRVSCGVGKGIVVGVSFGLLAGTSRPTRAFAIINGGYAACAAFFYFVTPAVVGWGSAPGVFLMLALSASLGAVMLRWYPRDRLLASRSVSGGLSTVPAFGWLAGGVLLLLAVGHGAIWTFVARLGEQHGLSRQQIGSALSLAALLTIAGPALASVLEVKRGFSLPLISGVLLKSAIGVSLVWTATVLAFFVLTPSFLLLNLFIIPYVMGMMSLADPAGRLAGSASAAQQAGNAGGALVGGILVSRVGYHSLATLLCGLLLAVLLLVCVAAPAATRRARAISP
jgi:DHA1 family inner membrane transport protein